MTGASEAAPIQLSPNESILQPSNGTTDGGIAFSLSLPQSVAPL
jgi:hypothetical protein